jgi:hypothetical protein
MDGILHMRMHYHPRGGLQMQESMHVHLLLLMTVGPAPTATDQNPAGRRRATPASLADPCVDAAEPAAPRRLPRPLPDRRGSRPITTCPPPTLPALARQQSKRSDFSGNCVEMTLLPRPVPPCAIHATGGTDADLYLRGDRRPAGRRPRRRLSSPSWPDDYHDPLRGATGPDRRAAGRQSPDSHGMLTPEYPPVAGVDIPEVCA